MPKQKIEIEVELTDGFEVTGEYRAPLRGEWFICTGSFMALQCDDDGYSLARVILRKSYVPPAWLKPGVTLYSNYGRWYATDGEVAPYNNPTNGYTSRSGRSCELISSVFHDFVPPPFEPYQIPEQK